MKICIITTSYHPYNIGGGEYSAKQLAEGLSLMGISVFVIAAYTKNVIEFVNGVKVYRVKSPNIYWSGDKIKHNFIKKLLWHIIEAYNPIVYRRVASIIDSEKPDVLHVRNISDFSSYIWRVGNRIGVPTVTTLNNYASICSKSTLFSNGKICEKRCFFCKFVSYPKRLTSKYANVVVGVSQFTLNKHLDLNYFCNAKKYVIRTQKELISTDFNYLSTGIITFGYIGQIRANKGVIDLIKAFSQVKLKNVQLRIAGDGCDDYFRLCKDLAKKDNRIKFLGRVDSDEFYVDIDVVVIPSIWHEPFPRVLVEAYACGRPVITTGNGGIKEMVEDKKSGLLYTDITSLQQAIEYFSCNSNQIEVMSNFIKKYVNIGNKNDLEQYVDIYRDLIY